MAPELQSPADLNVKRNQDIRTPFVVLPAIWQVPGVVASGMLLHHVGGGR